MRGWPGWPCIAGGGGASVRLSLGADVTLVLEDDPTAVANGSMALRPIVYSTTAFIAGHDYSVARLRDSCTAAPTTEPPAPRISEMMPSPITTRWLAARQPSA